MLFPITVTVSIPTPQSLKLSKSSYTSTSNIVKYFKDQ